MIDPANSHELAHIAREIGADVFKGTLLSPSETGGWQLGNLDLCNYLDRYHNQQVMVIIAPLGQAPAPSHLWDLRLHLLRLVRRVPAVQAGCGESRKAGEAYS